MMLSLVAVERETVKRIMCRIGRICKHPDTQSDESGMGWDESGAP